MHLRWPPSPSWNAPRRPPACRGGGGGRAGYAGHALNGGRRSAFTVQRARATCAPRGFSLLELVMVLAVIAMVSAIAVPRYAGAAAQYRVEAAARRIASDLAAARSASRNGGSSQTVTFSVDDASYELPGVTDPDRPSLPYAVRLSEAPYEVRMPSADFGGLPSVTFDGFGMPDRAGSVVVEVGDRRRTVTLNAVTGKAQIE